MHGKFPTFVGRVRVLSPSSQHYKKTTNSFFKDNSDFSSSNNSSSEMSLFMNNHVDIAPPPLPEMEETGGGNRVMVVVDSTSEAKSALQWALSHTLQTQDSILLLHVTKPSSNSKQGENLSNQRAYQLLASMKNICQITRPGVHVEIILKEGKEKGPVIVEEAKLRKVTLLVLGQRKRSMLWRLQRLWAKKRTRNNRVVDYCIENANCMTIAVRRKNRRHGGYLITTKRHKKFWLLA